MASPSIPATIMLYALIIVAAIVTMGVGLGTTHWVVLEISGLTITFGLFKVCVDGKCVAYDDVTPYSLSSLEVAKGMCITALVLYTITMVIIAHLVFAKRMVVQSKNHGSACVCICVCAAILAWAGVGHFTSRITLTSDYSDHWSYGYSIYLASASGVCCLVAGVLGVIGVSQAFKSQFPTGVVIQGGAQQGVPYPGVQQPGVQMASPGAYYGHHSYPQNYGPNMGHVVTPTNTVIDHKDVNVNSPPRY